MKNFFLLLFILIVGVYTYHWYTTQHAPKPVVATEDATPVPVVRKATPKPSTSSLNTSSGGLNTNSLQTRGLERGDGTPPPSSRRH